MTWLRIIGFGTMCLTLSACGDQYWMTNHVDPYFGEKYLVRRDTATSSSGESVAWNSAVQIPDPWPPGSNDPNIAFDGEKIRCAVQRYRKDKEFFQTVPLLGGTAGGGGAGLAAPPGTTSGTSGGGSSECGIQGGTGAGGGGGTAGGTPGLMAAPGY
jgi:hypothetical protein